MIRRFAKYYRPHLRLFIADFCAAALIAALDLVFPNAVRSVMNAVTGAIDSLTLAYLVRLGILLLVMYLIRYGLDFFVTYYGHMVGVRIEHDMRHDLFDHVTNLPFAYFDNTKTGQIMSRIVNDLNEIAELAHHGPEDFFISVVMLIGTFSMMMTMHWKLTLVLLVLVLPMIIFSVVWNKRLRASFRTLRAELGNINAQVEDSLSGVRVVKSFTGEKFERERFAEGNANFTKAKSQSYFVMAHFHSGVTMFSNLLMLATLVGGGYFLMRREIGVAELTAFLLYVELFLKPIRQLTTLVETYQRGMAAFSRFDEMMNVESTIQDKKNAIKVGRLDGAISFERVTFGYNENRNVLEDVNLSMRPGEIVALVGPSGGGKTTICNLIPRFYDVQAGAVKIDGIDVRDMTQRSLRRNIGIVQQDVFLFSGTVRENIAYAKPGASEDEIIAAAKRANAHEFILSLEEGYDTSVGQRGVKLSGGQKQRIAIARIFLKNPPILLLDEATSALDNETERIIQESLFTLSENRTTLIIAHRLATIRGADTILVMTDEGIVERGSHDELMKIGGLYAHLYNTQFDQLADDID
ncbi:ABC transporter ATP-binding protein/permease [Eubacteriales bacterium OttesenSCG-928-A19]|nr:ABC transporter ATP-binding protein/permease [Eubacteriales bacterium OttesenSCG-928-A19]